MSGTNTFEETMDMMEDTQKGKYLVFFLGKEEYGLEIKYAREIIGMQSITPVPGIQNYVKGVINLRGGIIPVIDVRLRFSKESREYDDRTCIVIIDIDDTPLGLIVDRVSDVVSISDADIAAAPKINREKANNNSFIKGIGRTDGNVTVLLDCYALITEEDHQDIHELLEYNY